LIYGNNFFGGIMKLTENLLALLETPCLIADMEIVRRNIRMMQDAADRYNCALRPHIKTHKITAIAKLQMEAGAVGITCAKVSEAEVFAEAGIGDIFVAYPCVGSFRIDRAIALAGKIPRLILAVDSEDGAKALSAAAKEAGVTFEVRLEIDTGAGRTGIPMEEAPQLALKVSRMPNLNLTGIYTFKSLLYQGLPTEDNEAAGREEGEMMAAAADAIRAAGVDIKDISAGSSPTGAAVAKTGLVTEIRPGTYVFKDVMQLAERVAEPDELAVRYAATVVSVSHDGYAVIDGGTKTFPSDVPLNTPPGNYPGYAIVEGMPWLRLSRMNEEHGIITSESGPTGLRVGQVITLLPVHVCTAVNMQNYIYLLDGGKLTKQKVDARGMLV
jgi:D-serine deaminase-like pyridoxal phosphate-dependent protein